MSVIALPPIRHVFSSGSPLEREIGFSRAVQCGPWLVISGTAPIGPDGATAHVGDLFSQTLLCLEIIGAAMNQAGLLPSHVVRTRLFLTRMNDWREAARAHNKYFHDIRPACSFIGVSRFIGPDWLVEVEADCFDDKWTRERSREIPILLGESGSE